MFRKNLSTLLLAFIFCVLVIYIVIYPNESFKAASDGLLLWFNVVLPALLPFFICVEILIGLGIVNFIGSCFRSVMGPIFKVPGEASFCFFMSISSGYPVGAKITSSLLQSNICTKTEAQRMLSLCSTSGPLFIIGAVATGILSNPKLGVLLASAHYLSALTAGFLMRFYGHSEHRVKSSSRYIVESYSKAANPLQEMLAYRKKDGRPFGILMGDAVRNGMNLILLIGGFIVLFSVITSVLKISGILNFLSQGICLLLPALHLNPEAVSSMIVGFMEMTIGIRETALLDIALVYKLMMVSFMIGFGGISINTQVLSVIAGNKLNFGLYFFMKLIQGAFAALYTYILFGMIGVKQVFNIYDSFNVSQYVRYLNSSMLGKAGDSILNLLIVLFLLVVTGFLLFKASPKQQRN